MSITWFLREARGRVDVYLQHQDANITIDWPDSLECCHDRLFIKNRLAKGFKRKPHAA